MLIHQQMVFAYAFAAIARPQPSSRGRYSHGIPVLRTNPDPSQGRVIIDMKASAFRRSVMGQKMICYKRPQISRK